MDRTIVAAYDGSPQSLDALALADTLARTLETRVVAATVYPSQQGRPQTQFRELEGALREAAERTAAGALEAEVAGAGRLEVDTIAGASPAAGLDAIATDLGAEMIVVGAPRRAAANRVVAGSVARRLLSGAPCAVGVAPHGFADRSAPDGDGVIGVGFDGSRESRVALEAAFALARSRRAALRLISVVAHADFHAEWSRLAKLSESLFDAYRREAARNALQDALAALPDDVDGDCRVRQGDPPAELAAEAATLDMLLLGSRGYGPLRRVVAGGTADRLVDNSPCPVVVYPRGTEATPAD